MLGLLGGLPPTPDPLYCVCVCTDKYATRPHIISLFVHSAALQPCCSKEKVGSKL